MTFDTKVDKPRTDEVVIRPLSRRERREATSKKAISFNLAFPPIAVLLALLTALGAWIRTEPTKTTSTTTEPVVATEQANATSLLLGLGDPSGAVDFLALVSSAKDGRDVLLIPTDTQVDVLSLGAQLIGNIPTLGDEALLPTIVANVLGVRVDTTVLLSGDELQNILGVAGQFEVDLSRSVVVDEDGTQKEFPAGTQTLTSEDAGLLLSGKAGEDGLIRTRIIQEVLEGWLGALADDDTANETLAIDIRLGPLLSLDPSNTDFSVLPTDSIESDSGESLLAVNDDETAKLMRERFGGLLFVPEGERPRVMILNGTGKPGQAQIVAQCVVPVGGDVRLAGNTESFGLGETEILYFETSDEALAQRIRGSLGVGVTKQVQRDTDAVDIIIRTGADFTSCTG